MPRQLVANPPWVTRAIAGSMEILQAKVPPQWLPRLASVKAAPRGVMTAKMKEYGCGSYGCVLPSLDDNVVIKATTDTTEAEFAVDLSPTLAAPIVVEYFMAVALSAKHNGVPITLLWRESAENVGEVEKVLGKRAEDLVDRQHKAAQRAFAAVYEREPVEVVRPLLDEWLDRCRDLRAVPELRELGEGFVKVFEEQGVLFGDVHTGNLGLVDRDGGKRWLIVDPGNVAVITKA